MYISVIWTAFRYSLRVLHANPINYRHAIQNNWKIWKINIYSARYVCYRFWALAMSIGTQPCKHCCQSMLAHLTSENRNSTYVYLGDRFFDFYTLHYINFFFLQHVQ